MHIETCSSQVSPTSAMFTSLVTTGEERANVTLPYSLKLFLISCLVNHLYDTEVVHRVLAFDFLKAPRMVGAVRALCLRQAGDSALILAGLFPERAVRLHVSNTYFRHMGQSSYTSLSAHLAVGVASEQSSLYARVACEFPSLERVLNRARGSDTYWDAYFTFLKKIQSNQSAQ